MAPAAQAEAIGSRRHAADRRELWATVLLGYMKGQTSPKSALLIGLTGVFSSRSTASVCIQWTLVVPLHATIMGPFGPFSLSTCA